MGNEGGSAFKVQFVLKDMQIQGYFCVFFYDIMLQKHHHLQDQQ